MEHIIQFGVTIDDQAIEQKIVQQASAAMLEKVSELSKSSWNSPSFLDTIAKQQISDLVLDHRDEIIDKAVNELMSNMMKTKKVKEKLEEIT